MTHSIGAVARTCGAALGVLITLLFLADVAARLSSAPDAAPATRTAARR